MVSVWLQFIMPINLSLLGSRKSDAEENYSNNSAVCAANNNQQRKANCGRLTHLGSS